MQGAGRDNTWSDETIDRLRDLWGEGHTTAEIGRRLGVSKNAVIGKVHRLNLPARPSPIQRGRPSGPRSKPARPIAPRLADILPLTSCAPAAMEPGESIRPCTVSAPSRRAEPHRKLPIGNKPCCWPIGDPGTSGFRFCADNALAGKPYCGVHLRAAYRKPRQRAEAAQFGT